MSAKAGERARKTGTFHCIDCDHTVRVHEGEKLRDCPCGSTEYDLRTNEPDTKG